MARRGDLLGCKILFNEKSNTGHVPVSFTINGQVIGKATVQINTTNKEFYPFVGTQEGIRLLFKMCSYKPAESLQQKKSDKVDKIFSTVEQMRREIELLTESVKEMQLGKHVREKIAKAKGTASVILRISTDEDGNCLIDVEANDDNP